MPLLFKLATRNCSISGCWSVSCMSSCTAPLFFCFSSPSRYCSGTAAPGAAVVVAALLVLVLLLLLMDLVRALLLLPLCYWWWR